MLLIKERVRPCKARLSRSLSGRVTLTALPSDSTFIAGCGTSSSLPLGPSTRILPPSRFTLTPAGMATGCLPIRDIAQSPNPKFEYRNPKQIRNHNVQNRADDRFWSFEFRYSNLFRISKFGFRIFSPYVAQEFAAQPF